jgi:hypothetical protein
MRLLMRLLVTVGISVLGLTTIEVGSAVAVSPWTVQPTPNPVIPTGELLGVSCLSFTTCIGVGFTSSNAGTNQTLAAAWNGSTWSVQSSPNPSGAIYSFLSGVSCTSTTACTAVGYYGNSAGTELTFAERWNGTTWSLQTTATPTGATFSALSGVSCTTATACIAVGNYGPKKGTELTLAEAWNGTVWSVQTTLNPSGATVGSLTGVSCASSTACEAVGSYFNKSGTELTLAEAWNGSAWSIPSTPNPTGGVLPVLSSVTCRLSTACTAVGNYFNSSGHQLTLAEAWNGTAWSIQSTPNPAGTKLSVLTGVSCITATSCTAVGAYYNSLGTTQLTLVETWNGTAWSIPSTPSPANQVVSTLLSVSCVAGTGFCLSGGYSANTGGTTTGLSLGYYGPYGWLLVSFPSPSGAATSNLTSVSCSSASVCTATGFSVNSAGVDAALAEAWNGATWVIQSVPVPTGATASSFSGVSCSAPNACEAVGNYVNSSGSTLTLAEHWNGTTWSIQATPNPTGATSSSLASVWCVSSSNCTAVGRSVTTAQIPLAEAWNGTSWTSQTIHAPTGAEGSALSAVSCVAANGFCIAAGYYDNSSGTKVTLAEGWYGPYGWLVIATPNPTGATASFLSGVSCSAFTACIATGSYTNSTGTLTLAETWNSTSFALQTTPNPGATLSALTGVSCTGASSCTAVGYYTNTSGFTVTLAEAWSGTSWAVQTTPNPSIATASLLYAVSCTAATTCTAVGRYNNGVQLTLAEVD